METKNQRGGTTHFVSRKKSPNTNSKKAQKKITSKKKEVIQSLLQGFYVHLEVAETNLHILQGLCHVFRGKDNEYRIKYSHAGGSYEIPREVGIMLRGEDYEIDF